MAKETKITLDDTYMNVIQFGTGKKNLAIVAGVSLCGLEGAGAGVEAAYSRFAEDYTVYLFDRKKVIPAGYCVEDMAEDVYRVLKLLHVDRTDIYGVSQGGMIAQCLAIRYPEMIHKMVLCSTLCAATPRMKKISDVWIKLAEAEDVIAINRNFFDVVYSPAFLEKNKELLPVLEKNGTPEDCRRFKVLAEACGKVDLLADMKQIKCPVLVLGDKNDQVTGVEGSIQISEMLGCEMFLYDQYSHAVYDEAPDITERIYRFLND